MHACMPAAARHAGPPNRHACLAGRRHAGRARTSPACMHAAGRHAESARPSTGVSSSVCSSVGASASFISTTSAPPRPRSSAVTGSPAAAHAAHAALSEILARRAGVLPTTLYAMTHTGLPTCIRACQDPSGAWSAACVHHGCQRPAQAAPLAEACRQEPQACCGPDGLLWIHMQGEQIACTA